jgi:hypothetical protein
VIVICLWCLAVQRLDVQYQRLRSDIVSRLLPKQPPMAITVTNNARYDVRRYPSAHGHPHSWSRSRFGQTVCRMRVFLAASSRSTNTIANYRAGYERNFFTNHNLRYHVVPSQRENNLPPAAKVQAGNPGIAFMLCIGAASMCCSVAQRGGQCRSSQPQRRLRDM